MKRPPEKPRRPLPEPAPASAARVLVLVGPTASGKTRLAIELARALGGELVSADSQQIYRGLDIGTAKPTPEERAAAPHHLIDLLEPDQTLSAGEFARRADEVIADVVRRGRLPIVVGGTGLWVRALLLGLIEAPPPDPELRRELEQRAEREGREALHAELERIDPETAATIPPQNLVRVVRALEIWRQTAEKPSAQRARHGFGRLRYRAKVLGLSPPREELYRRIDARAAAMFAAGLLDEVRALLAKGLRGAPALGALGYPQALAAAEGRLSVEEAIAATAQETRRYAKRQLTWFRADPLVHWLPWPPDASSLAEELEREGFAAG
jgi:tRNA dimethylallyltransferase